MGIVGVVTNAILFKRQPCKRRAPGSCVHGAHLHSARLSTLNAAVILPREPSVCILKRFKTPGTEIIFTRLRATPMASLIVPGWRIPMAARRLNIQLVHQYTDNRVWSYIFNRCKNLLLNLRRITPLFGDRWLRRARGGAVSLNRLMVVSWERHWNRVDAIDRFNPATSEIK